MKFAAPLLVASSLVAGTFAGPSRLSEDAGLDKRAGVNMCGQWDNIDYNSGLYRLVSIEENSHRRRKRREGSPAGIRRNTPAVLSSCPWRRSFISGLFPDLY